MQKLSFILIILCSCQSHSTKNNIEQVIREWQEREIQIPSEKIEYMTMGRHDTLCLDFWNKPYKILTYIDSVGCTGCQLGLAQWRKLIDSMLIQQLDVSFLFVVHSSDYEMFEYMLIENNFSYPIIYDRKNNFDKLNHFLPAPYRTFLLDKDNKILLVGSPIKNPKMWALYKKFITQSKFIQL
jgi:hypothetical protein